MNEVIVHHLRKKSLLFELIFQIKNNSLYCFEKKVYGSISPGIILKARREGLFLFPSGNGRFYIEKNYYRDGKLEGFAESFHENGNLQQTAEYSNGKLHGTMTLYDKDGSIESIAEYRDNKRHGIATHYYSNGDCVPGSKAHGTIRRTEEYSNGKLVA